MLVQRGRRAGPRRWPRAARPSASPPAPARPRCWSRRCWRGCASASTLAIEEVARGGGDRHLQAAGALRRTTVGVARGRLKPDGGLHRGHRRGAARLPGRLRLGELVAFRGIAEGVENSNYALRTDGGRLHPDAVREAGGPGGAALVPRADGASGGARPALPAAGARPRRRGAAHAGRAAGGDLHLPARRLAAPGAAGALRAAGRGAGAAARGRRAASPRSAPNALGPGRLGAAAGPLPRAAATRCSRAGRRSWTRRWRRSWRAWPRGSLPVGQIHADLFPDNVFFLPSRTAGRVVSGLIDFYFACTDLLAYDVAVCLNAWCFEPDCVLQRDQGAGAAGAPTPRSARCRRRSARRCRCCAAARRSASC